MGNDAIVSSVKDADLVEKRRNQIVKAAISLFKQKGFHRTTTREIAKESGFSIGTLYEYIRTKEDVLFLVFETVNLSVFNRMKEIMNAVDTDSLGALANVLNSYYRLMDQKQEEILILYQELKSLPQEKKEIVLSREREMVHLLKHTLQKLSPHHLSEQEAEILANNIFVQGHMWGFRRWIFHNNISLDEYIESQIQLVLKSLTADENF